MKTKYVLLWVVLAALAVATLGIAIARDHAHSPVLTGEAAAGWSTAMTHLEKGEAAMARQALARWIAAAEAKGIRSPEAYFNLAIAHWGLKEPGPAGSAVLRSLLATPSLAQIARAHSILAAMQRELGVSDTVARENRFLARIWLTDNGLTFFLMLAFWSAIGISLWLYQQRPTIRRRDILGSMTPTAIALLVASFGLALRDWKGSYAVLDGTDSPVGLFPSPRLDTQEKLLDLPSGTLVHSTGESQNGFLRIDSPIVAWVPTTQIQLPD